jgi:D-alanyl-D-alanine carboxypeptidase/D-alanyl-D-alanine-endopeptidase (penicillin-binding protein 4)
MFQTNILYKFIQTTFFLVYFANFSVAQSVHDVLYQVHNKGVHWSVSIRNGEGEVLEEWNAEKWVVPASNMKLITSAAALHELGSDFRFETSIYGNGYLQDSLWVGDLIIVGSGDPSISGFLYDEDRYHVFNKLRTILIEAGIASWTGQWVGLLGYFDAEPYPKGWDWDDLNFYYGVEISELSFNNNAVDLVVQANGNTGDTPEISWFPDSTDYVTIENKQVIGDIDSKYDEFYRRSWESNILYLASSLPPGYEETESLAIHDAPRFFMDSFVRYLASFEMASQTFTDEPFRVERRWPETFMSPKNSSRDNIGSSLWAGYEPTWMSSNNTDARENWTLLGIHSSKPLSELVAWLNKESDNFYAEMILKTLAAEKRMEPGSTRGGIEVVRNALGSLGVDTAYVVMRDGSGLAGGNFLTTSVISELLFVMSKHHEFDVFESSLPILGEDGTLHYRMKQSPLRGQVFAKTGYVGGARSLSGYLNSQSGEKVIFSLSANNFVGKVSRIDAVHEQILTYLYYHY